MAKKLHEGAPPSFHGGMGVKPIGAMVDGSERAVTQRAASQKHRKQSGGSGKKHPKRG